MLLSDSLAFFIPFILYRVDRIHAPIIIYKHLENGSLGQDSTGIDWYILLAGVVLSILVLSGFYAARRSIWDELRLLSRTVLFAGLIDAFVLYTAGYKENPSQLLLSWVMVGVSLPVLRVVAKNLLLRLHLWQVPTIVVGSGDNAEQTWQALRKQPMMGYDVRLFLQLLEEGANPADCGQRPALDGVPVQARPFQLALDYLQSHRDFHVVVAPDDTNTEGFCRLINHLAVQPNSLDIVPTLRGLPLYGTDVVHLFAEELLMLRVRNNLARPGPRIFKRAFDLVTASILLLVLSPVFAFLAIRIKIEDGGPVFYAQDRVGVDGRIFPCFKFRSMVINAEETLARWKAENPDLFAQYQRNNFKLKDDPRVTRIGRFIRAFSLDELPQLANVLLGQMTLVGPRPLLAREVGDYGEGIIHYYRTRPGITGLWQVSGRSETRFCDRAFFDEWYIKNWSMWLDLVILIKTVQVVVGRSGAY